MLKTVFIYYISEVLTYIATSTSQMFATAGGSGHGAGGGEKPKPFGGQNVWNIHSKSRLLFTTLALVGSPLHALYKVQTNRFTTMQYSTTRMKAKIPSLTYFSQHWTVWSLSNWKVAVVLVPFHLWIFLRTIPSGFTWSDRVSFILQIRMLFVQSPTLSFWPS